MTETEGSRDNWQNETGRGSNVHGITIIAKQRLLLVACYGVQTSFHIPWHSALSQTMASVIRR